MSRHRLTPIYADEPAPPPVRRKPRPLRIAKMKLPVIVMLYGVLCGWRLLGDNVHHAGLDVSHWTRERLHFQPAFGQAAMLTVVLAAFDMTMRFGSERTK